MPMSHDLKCVYVHIPKTAGTSIEKAMGMFDDWRVENTSKMFGLIQSPQIRERIRVTKFLQHLTAAELRELAPDEFHAYHSFSFVRNPWDRMVSIYCNKDPNLIEYAHSRGIDLTNTTFNEFLHKTEELVHVHLIPQHEFIVDRNGNVLVNFVGRFERIFDDFSVVCNKLNIQRVLPYENRSLREDYRKYYDPKSRDHIERRYKDDIEFFGYSF